MRRLRTELKSNSLETIQLDNGDIRSLISLTNTPLGRLPRQLITRTSQIWAAFPQTKTKAHNLLTSSGNKLRRLLVYKLSTILTVSNNKMINREVAWMASKKTKGTKEPFKSSQSARNSSNSHRLWSRGLESWGLSRTDKAASRS